MKQNRLIVAALTLLVTTGFVTTTVCAQTAGTERRGERRDNRDEGREEKAACKAGDEKSRAECRGEKRDTKQEGRGNDEDKTEAEKPEGT
jgi:hypothetical protein